MKILLARAVPAIATLGLTVSASAHEVDAQPVPPSAVAAQRSESPTAQKLQDGPASWYQMGRKTANGEAFDPNGLTAAHRTLPFGSKIKVVNERNGRSVVVRINDRGPYAGGRIIDLARGAAESLGMTESGVIRVALYRAN
jgi:rare lipoprotein A